MNAQDFINQAIASLRDGGTILYPTDTIWGIGCDASNSLAVEKIYSIKQRDHSKSMLILALPEHLISLHDDSANRLAWNLLTQCDRPTTVIFPQASLHLPFLASNLPAGDGSIGIRIPHHDFCQKLLTQFGKPIVSTSANFSGAPSPAKYEDIEHRLFDKVNYALPDLPEFRSSQSQSSRILKVSPSGDIITIRG